MTRALRIKTQQVIVPDLPPTNGFPTRRWRLEVFLLDEDGKEVPACIFESITYHLHPTFNPSTKKLTQPPFRLDEEGWGEFGLQVVGVLKGQPTTYTFHHEISFTDDAYVMDFNIDVPYHIESLRDELLKSGSVPIYDIEQDDIFDSDKLQKAIKRIPDSDVDTIQKMVQTIISFEPVKNEVSKRFHKDTDYVLLLSQLPNRILNKVCDIINSADTQ